MGFAKHVGRVGGLAFALGVGIGLGAAPGVAFADETGTTATAPPAEKSAGRTHASQNAADGATRHSCQADSDEDKPQSVAQSKDVEEVEQTRSSNGRADTRSHRLTAAASSDEGTEASAQDASPDEPEEAASAPEITPPAVSVVVVETVAPAIEPTKQQVVEPTAMTLSTVLAPLPGTTDAPGVPAESPGPLILLAAARRELTQEQVQAIHRVGEIGVGAHPTDVVATDIRAYVANAGSNSVSVIDTITGTVLKTITLASSPTTLAVTPDGSRVYVTRAGSDRVSVINTVTNAVIKTIIVGDSPTGIAVSPNGNTVYVVNSGSGTVSKISTTTNLVVGTVYGVAKGVSSIAVSTDGSKIYTVSDAGGDVSYFSPFSLVAKTISDVTTGSHGLAFTADGSRVFVTDVAGSVHIIDTASHQVIDSIDVAVGVPWDVAVSADGTTLFVARSDDGKLSVYDIASKAELTSIVANPYLAEGAPSIAVSPDGTELYWTDDSSDRIHVIALTPPNSDPVVASPVVNVPNASGVVTGSVSVTDAEGNPLTVTVSTTAKGKVVVTQDNGIFSFTYTPTAAARHAAAATGATAEDKQDVFTLIVSDGHHGVIQVPVAVVVTPANAAPTATAKATSSWLSATVFVTVTGRDPDKDGLTFTATGSAKGGTVEVGAKGKFTYTPTAEARHAAAAAGATEADKQDTFDVTVGDGHGGFTTVSVTVKIKPGNTKPGVTVRTSSSWFSAAVYGTVTAKDPEGDPLAFSVSPTDKGGTVVINSRGRFTYTPSDAARHAAAATGATAEDKQDTFGITVSDGHGGTTTVTVSVKIKPVNAAPSRVSASDVTVNPNSGVTTGKITALDADGDAFTFAVPPPTRKGSVVIGADGAFTYAPTAETRAAASKRFAPSWDKTDSFKVTVDDGHGALRTLTVRVVIAPLGYSNNAPIDGNFTAGQPLPSSGKVSGTVTASDPDGDTLSFAGSGMTPKGSVIVNLDGTFVYTPSDAARHQANGDSASEADKKDVFSVTASDGYGGTLSVPVTVAIGPSVNKVPTNGSYTAAANLITGVVLGGATANDANNDTLSYTGSTTTAKGSVVVHTAGDFEYTPKDAARVAAGAVNAPAADKKDNFTIFVKDGHGGTLAIPVTVPIVGPSTVLGGAAV